MKKKRQRRSWSDEDKRRIVGQTRVPGVSVSQVARRYDVNANQVFNWRRDPRFCGAGDDAMRFLPVEIVQDPVVQGHEPETSSGTIEIVLGNGNRINLSGAFDLDAVIRLVQALNP